MIWLPRPPSIEEVERSIPKIDPVPDGTERPFWSVMIPTYNCANYLRETLASVLAQDPGPDRMQIEVIDDCSQKDDPDAVVRELGNGRVSFYRQPTNQGATRTFNTCLERARGHWVHVLHGDDRVRLGYYRDIEKALFVHTNASMVFCRVKKIDERSIAFGESSLVGPACTGVIPDFATRQSCENLCFFPSVVVKRSVYEAVGGFCTYFGHVADMDMWRRAGTVGDVVYLPEPLAEYRVHSASDTRRLVLTGENVVEIYKLVATNMQRMGSQIASPQWRSQVASVAEYFADQLRDKGRMDGARRQAALAFAISPSVRRAALVSTMWIAGLLGRVGVR